MLFPYSGDDRQTMNVEATVVNLTHIFFECPRCKPCGRRRKQILHIHGSQGNLTNRIEHRSAHCSTLNRHKYPADGIEQFLIHITDNTVKRNCV